MKKALFIIIVVVLIILAFGVFFGWQYLAEIFKFYPEQIKTQNEAANWKTYTNTQHGFEFKYPSNWKLEQSDLFTIIKSPDFKSSYYESGAELLVNGSKIRILNSNLGRFSSVQEYINSQEENGFNLSDRKQIKIGEVDSVEYYWGYEGPVELFVNFIKDGYLHQITFVSVAEERNDKDYSIFKEILSTFKFINK